MEIDNLDIAASIESVEPRETETWNMSLVDQLTSLEGRINRLRYLIITILYLIVAIVYLLPVSIVLGIIMAISGLPEFIFDFLLGLALIPAWYCAYAITVKRLQDMNWGDGWITYLQIYMILCIIWGMAPVGSGVDNALDLITWIMSIPLIVCIFIKGEKGPNQFGPDPLG